MRTKTIYFITSLLLLVSVFSFSGCSKLFGPSDADVIKAINDGGFFSRGGITLTSPITVLEKGSRNKDGAWPVKVRAVFTYKTKNGVSAPVDEPQVFYIHKAKDSSGKDIWIATSNP